MWRVGETRTGSRYTWYQDPGSPGAAGTANSRGMEVRLDSRDVEIRKGLSTVYKQHSIVPIETEATSKAVRTTNRNFS